jgi:hypothetical protein
MDIKTTKQPDGYYVAIDEQVDELLAEIEDFAARRVRIVQKILLAMACAYATAINAQPAPTPPANKPVAVSTIKPKPDKTFCLEDKRAKWAGETHIRCPK